MFDEMSEAETKQTENVLSLQSELHNLEAKSKRSLTDDELNRMFELRKDISQSKHESTSDSKRTAYFLDTGHLLFDYYDRKSAKSIQDRKQFVEDSSKETVVGDKKTVLDFFSRGKQNQVVEKNKTEDSTTVGKNVKNVKNMDQIIEEYMSKVDNSLNVNPILNRSSEYCEECQNHKIFIEAESIIICTKCGVQESILMNQTKPSYKDPPREYTFFAYKRINHFNEWLSQFQAKESTHIPEKIIQDLKKEIQKERIVDQKSIDIKCIRRFLKKLGYNKYYEHIPHIINKLVGVQPPIITPVTEEKLRTMFKMIQVPFAKHCPPKRKNFLSYSYVLHKFVELLEMHELKPCFPLLKSRQKLYLQDKIWNKICCELNWTFIKSV